jgi:hypothetical protein
MAWRVRRGRRLEHRRSERPPFCQRARPMPASGTVTARVWQRARVMGTVSGETPDRKQQPPHRPGMRPFWQQRRRILVSGLVWVTGKALPREHRPETWPSWQQDHLCSLRRQVNGIFRRCDFLAVNFAEIVAI